MTDQILVYVLGVALGVISYFLKMTMDRLKDVESKATSNAQKCYVLENEYNLKFVHMSEKFDELHSAVRDLTLEIKSLTRELHQKKNY
jgi:uncharacterized coiled-coil DUF342 family protein